MNKMKYILYSRKNFKRNVNTFIFILILKDFFNVNKRFHM